MPTQQDTLTLAAQVVDQFSAPLASLTKQLRAFSSVQQDSNRRGTRDTQDSWKAYRSLAQQVEATASATKKLLLPAVEGLGLASLTTMGSIAGVAAAMKTFGQSAKELSYLSRETGQTKEQLRQLLEVGERLGIAAPATAASLERLSAGLEQARHNRGDLLMALNAQAHDPAIRVLAQQLRTAKTDAEGLADIVAASATATEQGKRKLFEITGLDPRWSRATAEMQKQVAEDLGKLTEKQIADAAKLAVSLERLGTAIKGIVERFAGDVAPAISKAVDAIREFVQENEGLVKIGGTLATIAGSATTAAVGWKLIRGLLSFGGGGAAGAAGAGIIGGVGGGVAGAARFGLTGAAAAALAATLNPQGLNEGEDELARQRKYGRDFGRGHRALMARAGHDGLHPISGALSDIAQVARGEEATYKAVLRGSREGVIQAFQQILRDRQAGGGGGGGGGITQAAYHPGEGVGVGGLAGGAGAGSGAPGQDSGPGGVTGAGEPPTGRGAAQRAILGGRVKEFARSLREKLGGQPGGSVMDMIKTAAGGDKKIESAMQSIFSGESSHGAHYDIGDKANGPAYGPFQLNVGKGRLGDIFQKETGLDLRGPGTIGAQAKWVAKHLREKFAKNPNYNPGSEWMGYGYRPGQTGGGMAPGDALRNAGLAPGVRGSAAAAASFAESMQGLKDHDAAGHAAITQYLRTGGAGMDPATISWCGAFVESSMHKAGVAGPAGAAVATNWARWGTHVDPANARRGDVFVNMRGRPPGQLGGHVGLVTGPAVDGQIPTIEGDVRAPGGGHMVRAVSERIRQGLEIRRAPVGLDANARKHMAPGVVKHEGHARVSVDFRGMPRGVKVAAGKPEGIFKEVRVDRGRGSPVADTG